MRSFVLDTKSLTAFAVLAGLAACGRGGSLPQGNSSPDEERAVTEVYQRLSRYSAAGGDEARFSLSDFRTYRPGQFGKLRWVDVITMAGGAAVDTSIVATGPGGEMPAASPVQYRCTWTDSVPWSDNPEAKKLENITVAGALDLAHRQAPEEAMDFLAVTSFNVKVALHGRTREYRSSFFWRALPQPGVAVKGSDFLPFDNITQGVDNIAIERRPALAAIAVAPPASQGIANRALGDIADFVGNQQPFGSFDAVDPIKGGVRVQGWTIDPDTADSISVHVYVDSVFAGSGLANLSRPDVDAAFHRGANRGFVIDVPATPGGTVCVYAIDSAGGTNPLLGCKPVPAGVISNQQPFGYFDVVDPIKGGYRVQGWTLDPDTADSIPVHVYVDNVFAGWGIANLSRPDVDAAFHKGANRGFAIDVAATPGGTVCTYAIDSAGGTNPLLGCKTVPAKPIYSEEEKSTSCTAWSSRVASNLTLVTQGKYWLTSEMAADCSCDEHCGSRCEVTHQQSACGYNGNCRKFATDATSTGIGFEGNGELKGAACAGGFACAGKKCPVPLLCLCALSEVTAKVTYQEKDSPLKFEVGFTFGDKEPEWKRGIPYNWVCRKCDAVPTPPPSAGAAGTLYVGPHVSGGTGDPDDDGSGGTTPGSGTGSTCAQMGWYAGDQKGPCDVACGGECVRKQVCGAGPCADGYCWKCPGPTPPPPPPPPEPDPQPQPQQKDCGDMGWYGGDQYEQCTQDCGDCVRKQQCGDGPCASGYCWKCQ